MTAVLILMGMHDAYTVHMYTQYINLITLNGSSQLSNSAIEIFDIRDWEHSFLTIASSPPPVLVALVYDCNDIALP